MTYILPMRHFEYEDYHNRLTRKRHSAFFLEKPLAIKFHKEQKEQLLRANSKRNPQKAMKEETKIYNKNSKIIAELTGKGQLFNEMI